MIRREEGFYEKTNTENEDNTVQTGVASFSILPILLASGAAVVLGKNKKRRNCKK